jgi:hypothetical protein
MSNRERWTVYPLLFLTLGIALTDKITRQVRTDIVVCKTLRVTDRTGEGQQVIISSNPGGGILRAQGNNQGLNVVLGHANQLVGLMFTDANDKPIGLGTVLHAIGRLNPIRQPAPDGNVNAPPDEPQQQSPPAEEQPPEATPGEPK